MLKKKADIIPQAVLAVMAIVLVSACVYVFISNHSNVNAKLTDSEFLNSIYIKQGKINFYVNQIMNNLTEESYEKGRLASDFKTELARYTQVGNHTILELKQIETQVSESAFSYSEIDGKKIVSIELSFILEEKVEKDGKEKASASYRYKKRFEKAL